MSTLLIDGDVLVYRFANSEQRVTRWHRDLYTFHAELPPAKLHVEDFIAELREATGAQSARIFLSDVERNFRKEDLTRLQYKAARAGIVRPLLWKPLRTFLEAEHGAIWEPRLEGDDLLGLYYRPGDVIATIDKDLRTVPCRLYNWDKPEEGIVEVTRADARRFFLTQVLTGDRVDGYSGCPGVGPVTAERLLDRAELDPWAAVVRAYGDAGLDEGVALETARAAWILRGDDYDFTAKRVRPWTPERLED